MKIVSRMKNSAIKKKKIICFISSLTVFLMFPCSAFANSQTISIIEAYKEAGMLENLNVITYLLRKLGWLLAQGLYYLVNGLEDVVLSINNILGEFVNSIEFTSFFDKVKPMLFGLFALSVLILGLMFMVKPKIDKAKVVTNVIVALLLITGMPFVISEFKQLTDSAIEGMREGDISLADQVLFENVTDVSIYDNLGMPVPIPMLDPQIRLSKEQIIKLDATEVVDYKDMDNKDVWKHTVKYDKNGLGKLEKNDRGDFGIDFTSELYYRYKIDYFSIYVTLLISALALIFIAVKIARLLYELAINQTIALFTAVTDLAGGERLKKAIEMIIGTFIILFSCFFFLQLFVIGSSFCGKYIDNIFARLIAQGALAWAVIDGPNLIERIVGIDAGINSSLQQLSSMYFAGQTLRAIGKGVGGLAKNTVSGAVRTAASTAGKVAGAVSAYQQTTPNASPTPPPSPTGLVPTDQAEHNEYARATSPHQQSEQPSGESTPVKEISKVDDKINGAHLSQRRLPTYALRLSKRTLPAVQKHQGAYGYRKYYNSSTSDELYDSMFGKVSDAETASPKGNEAQGNSEATASTASASNKANNVHGEQPIGETAHTRKHEPTPEAETTSTSRSSASNFNQTQAPNTQRQSAFSSISSNESVSQDNSNAEKSKAVSNSSEDIYAGRTWKTERMAQVRNSNPINTFKRSYNLTKNGIMDSYDRRMSKPKKSTAIKPDKPNTTEKRMTFVEPTILDHIRRNNSVSDTEHTQTRNKDI